LYQGKNFVAYPVLSDGVFVDSLHDFTATELASLVGSCGQAILQAAMEYADE